MSTVRVNVFHNSPSSNGFLLAYRHSLEDLAVVAAAKFQTEVYQFYNDRGCIVDDDALVRDGDVLYAAAEGEPFRGPGSRLAEAVEPGLERRPASPADRHQTGADDTDGGGDNGGEGDGGGGDDGGDWVTLNVGGRRFTTSRSTLTGTEPDSMLARMFSGESGLRPADRDASGAYLIDRSATYFEPLLHFLRTKQLVLDAGVNPAGVLQEARYFGVESLVRQLAAPSPGCCGSGGGRAQLSAVSSCPPLHRLDVVRALLVTAGDAQLRFQGVNLSGADLSRLDLRNCNLKYACLRECDMRHCTLTGCCLERADLSGACLDFAQLSCVKMMCANLEGASMRSCNFEDPAGIRANLEGAHMKGTVMTGSNMSSINLRVATLKNANLQDCDLRLAILAGADLENCNLSGSDLHEANLRGANLTNTAFELMLTPIHMSQTVR